MNNMLTNKKLIFFSLLVISTLTIFLASGIFGFPAKATGPSEAGGAAVIHSLEMDPRDSRIIYAGTRDGLFKTKNSGETWESLGLKQLIIWDIEVFDNRIYAATHKGIYKSNDEGKSWILISDKIGTTSILTFSGINPDIIYTGGQDVRTIFKSTDGGDNWQSLQTNLPPEVFFIVNLETDPSNPQVVYTRVQLARQTGEFTHEIIGDKVLKSVDGGKTWSEIPDFEFKIQGLIIDPHNLDIRYKSTFTGVAKSKDGGKTWETTGWVIRSATSLIVDPSNPDTIYVGTEGNGIWRSIDKGVHWDEAGLKDATIYSLEAVFAQKGGLVLAVAGTNYGIFKAHKSIEPAIWDLAGVGDFGGYVTMDPRDYNIFYAGNNMGIGRDPQNPDIIFYNESKEGKGGVLKSLDAGETWSSINNGIFKPTAAFDWIKYITVNPYDSNVIYMTNGQNGGIYKSINAGESWQKISMGLEEVYASSLAVAPDNTIYIGVYEANGGNIKLGVFRSRDGGQAWENTSLIDKKIRTIKIDSSTIPYTIYAGTYGEGAYKSLDEGETWISVDEELVSRGVSVNAIAIVPLSRSVAFHPLLKNLIKPALAAPQQGSLVYLATDEGVHVYEVAFPPTEEEEATPRRGFTLLQYFVMIFPIIVILGLIGWWIYRRKKEKVVKV